jgi:arylformamidase
MAASPAAREADITGYHSYRFPDDFDVSWPDFYREADRRAARVRASLRNQRHVLYGTHPHQLVNLFLPAAGPSAAPVFVFAHGGGFREGHPDHYDSLAAPFAERGAIFASIGYRLRPEADIAEAVDDGAHAVAWIHRNLERYGGDRRRIFVGGHSAGAMIAASLSVRDDWQAPLGLPPDVIAGAALVSGSYDWARRPEIVSNPSAHRLDPSRNLRRMPGRLVIAFGPAEANRRGADRSTLAGSSRRFAEQIVQGGGDVEVVSVEGADHRDTVRMLGEAQSPIFQAVERMIWPQGGP